MARRLVPKRISSRDVWVVLLNTLAAGLGVLFLWKVRTIVSWALIALLVALALEPAVAWLTRHRIKRTWAVLAVLLAGVGFFATVVATMVPLLIDQGQALIARAPELASRLEASHTVRWADDRFQVLERLQAALRSGTAPALAAARSVVHGLAGFFTVGTLTAFMLLFGDELFRQGLEWLPPNRRNHWLRFGLRMRKVVGGYVAGTVMVAGVSGVVMGATLAILGVPYFVPLGLVLMVLGIIPFLGSALGAVLLVGITFATSGLRAAVICAAVFLVYNWLKNRVLQPLVQRRTLQMNPLIITVALLAGTSLAGLLGAVLALPVAGAVQLVLQDQLKRRAGTFERRRPPVRPPEPVSPSVQSH